MNLKSLQSVAETYLAMLRPKAAASVSKPKWVPASITEENVAAFVQAVTEARKANKSVLKFKGKKYAIKGIKEEASEEADQGAAKKLQGVSTANALKQPSDEVPDEVKEEDEEEIKKANHDEKEADADEMPELDEPKLSEEDEDEEDSDKKDDEEDDNGDDDDDDEVEVEEELVGNQHKLDVNKDGEIDAEDLKKLRGEETEEDEEEEDEKEEDEKPKMTGEQTIASVAATYAAMVNENVAGDPHAATLSSKANSATALAHTSDSETHHEDARDAHRAAAEHYRVYAHHAGDSHLRNASKIHHTFHDDMANHHVLQLVSLDMDKAAHNMAAKHYGKKSVAEGAPGDAKAGPEVMDPATQKMKDAHDDETEIVDMLPTAAAMAASRKAHGNKFSSGIQKS